MTLTRLYFLPFYHTEYMRTQIHIHDCDIDDNNVFWIQVKRLFAFQKNAKKISLLSLLSIYNSFCCLDSFLMTETSRFSLSWRKMFYSLFASYNKNGKVSVVKEKKIILSHCNVYTNCVSIFLFHMNHTKHHKCASLTPSMTN